MENDFDRGFTLAEVVEMGKLYKEMGGKSLDHQFYQEVATKFSNSVHRCGKSSVRWEQVQSWFQDKQKELEAKVSSFCWRGVSVAELSDLVFEAKSSKDLAWYDVASFVNYRVTSSGELEVRVRYAGYDKWQDEWLNVKRAVRERSIPLEHSECERVKVGDLVLCFREHEDHAVYRDARIVDIQRRSHDSENCSCIFVVRFDHDFFEDQVQLNRICCRPAS